MHSVCCCSLPVWRRSFLKKGTPVTYFCPALDPPLDGSGRKTTTLVRDLEYFIHTKFHQNPSSGSGEEVENVNSLTDDGRRTTDGRQTDDRRTTDAGKRVITIGHWSLWLLCPKKDVILVISMTYAPMPAENFKMRIQIETSTKMYTPFLIGLN